MTPSTIETAVVYMNHTYIVKQDIERDFLGTATYKHNDSKLFPGIQRK